MSASQAQPVFGRMIPAMITPFKEDRSIDYDRAQELAVRLMEGGSDSLIIMGTTGECPTASYAEKTNLFKAVVEAIDGRIPVIANVGDNCTEHSLDFAQPVKPLIAVVDTTVEIHVEQHHVGMILPYPREQS